MARASSAMAALLVAALTVIGCSSDGPTRPAGAPDPFAPASTSAAPSSSTGSSLSIASGTTNPTGLAVGQCFDSDGFSLSAPLDLSTARVVPCDGPHQQEVFAVIVEPDPPGAPYPGEAVMTSFAGDACLAAFSPYTGLDYEASSLDIAEAEPTQTSWDAGDRATVCALHAADFEPLQSSARVPG